MDSGDKSITASFPQAKHYLIIFVSITCVTFMWFSYSLWIKNQCLPVNQQLPFSGFMKPWLPLLIVSLGVSLLFLVVVLLLTKLASKVSVKGNYRWSTNFLTFSLAMYIFGVSENFLANYYAVSAFANSNTLNTAYMMAVIALIALIAEVVYNQFRKPEIDSGPPTS